MKKQKIIFPMIKREWNSLRKNWWLKLVLLVIIFIPIIYTSIFLGSMWDPYGNTKDIPVAVVNHDEEADYMGQKLNIGEELVDNLKENNDMDFRVVSEKEANEGLVDGSYYMVIEIPKNFSENATTMLNDNPQKMVIEYNLNPGKNYIATKIDETAMNSIKNTVSNSVTETYAKTIFEAIEQLNKGLKDADKGTTELIVGEEKLQRGTNEIENRLKEFEESTIVFSNGQQEFEKGIKEYLNGTEEIDRVAKILKEGNDEIAENIRSFTDGITKLQQGINSIVEGNELLNNSLSQMDNAMGEVTSYNSDILKNTEKLVNEIKEINTLANKNKTDADSIAETVGNLIENVIKDDNISNEEKLEIISTELSNMQNSLERQSENIYDMGMIQSMNLISETTSDINNVLLEYNTAIKNYTTKVKDVSDNISLLSRKSTELSKATMILKSGMDNMTEELPTMISGIGNLNKGISGIKDGTQRLTEKNTYILNAEQQLKNGSFEISKSVKLLSGAVNQVGSGIEKLTDGTKILSEGIKSGSEKSNIKADEKNYQMIAEPVITHDNEISTVENNGSAMAPYMMSVALYVAAMAFTLMYPLLKNIRRAKSGFRYWCAKASVMYLVSTLAAIVMVGLLMTICGFNPKQVSMIYIFAILVSAGFMSMIVFFNAAFGRVGEFLMLIYMVINLGGSAGTYPLETSGNIFKNIHPYVPFSYSVDGFRNAISMENTQYMMEDIKVFVLMTICFAVATIIYYGYRKKNPKPILEAAFPVE